MRRRTTRNPSPRNAKDVKSCCLRFVDELRLRLQKLTQEPTELSLSIDDHILQMQNLVYDYHLCQHTNRAFGSVYSAFKKLPCFKETFLRTTFFWVQQRIPCIGGHCAPS